MKQTKLILLAALTAALAAPVPFARAASSSMHVAQDETPPPAEAPYPNAPEEGFTQKAAPRIAEPTNDGAMTDAIVDDPVANEPSTAQVVTPEMSGDVDADVSQEPLTPAKHAAAANDDDESQAPHKKYGYTHKRATDPNAPKPKKTNLDGSYDYGKEEHSDQYRYKSIRAKEVNYNEHDKPPKSDHSSSLRLAFFGPPAIENPNNNLLFKDIYSSQKVPCAILDYEWKISHSIGDLGVKVGSGLFFAQGKGRWVNPERQSDKEQPLEHFTFTMFPNTLSAIYRFKYADRQVIVPYGEGGPGFFTFMETRDDSKGPKFGGALAVFFAGGFNILIDGLDRDSMKNLRQDYGINHLYLNAEYRQIVGLNNKYDFSSSVVAGGLGVEF